MGASPDDYNVVTRRHKVNVLSATTEQYGNKGTPGTTPKLSVPRANVADRTFFVLLEAQCRASGRIIDDIKLESLPEIFIRWKDTKLPKFPNFCDAYNN